MRDEDKATIKRLLLDSQGFSIDDLEAITENENHIYGRESTFLVN
jgi:hypothetical protein